MVLVRSSHVSVDELYHCRSIQDNFLREFQLFHLKSSILPYLKKSLNSLNPSKCLSKPSYHQNHIITKGKPLQSLTEPFRPHISHFYPLHIHHRALAPPRAFSLSRRSLTPRHLSSILLSLIPPVLSEPFTPYRRYAWF